jgi:hypothetical protein
MEPTPDVPADESAAAEPRPRMDVSPPSPLRLAGFGAAALGALVAGIGSLMEWVTVGIEGFANLDSPTRGVEILDGKITLACAAVLLIGTMVSRVARPTGGRTGAALAVLLAGLACVAIAAGFLMTVSSRFDPVSSDELADQVAAQLGVPVEVAEAQLEDTVESLGGFRDVGPGPIVVLGGGLVGALGGLLTLVWTRRIREASVDHGRAVDPGPPGLADRPDV